MSLCLATAGIVKSVSIAAFMLTFTPATDQGEWQEDWRVTPQGLEILEARAKGFSEMDVPADSRSIDGWYRWTPRLPILPEIVIANSGFAGNWRLCSDGKCQDISAILGHPPGKVTITTKACQPDAPKQLDTKMLLARGDDFNVKGDPDRAIADYDAALKADPAFAEALNSRSMAWRAKGDRRRALSDLDAALRLKPDYEAARANRKSLFNEIERLGAQMPLKGKGK